MNKILRWMFKPYKHDIAGAYLHYGVGYTGMELNHNLCPGGRVIHNGMGYNGLE
jgi:hypothetical protein